MHPSREEFRALAAGHTVVPVWRELAADLETPVSAYLKLGAGHERSFLLESVEHGERWGRFSFVGRGPSLTLVARGGTISVTGEPPPGSDMPTDRGVLAAVEALLAAYRSPVLPELPPLHGGVVGYLGYDVVREVERLPAVPPDDQGHPDAVLSVIGQVAAFDHLRQRVYLVDNVVVGAGPSTTELGSADAAYDAYDAAYEAAAARLDALAADLGRPLPYVPAEPPDPADPLPEVRSTVGPEAYCRAVEKAQEHIRAGDIFQVVPSQRFDLDLGADPFDVYRVLRQVNPSPYMYFLRHPEITLVGSSPEPMVQLRNGRVVTRPIAGSRPRGTTEAEDDALAADLVADPKELAEHVMLVDLARNDLGRVVSFGTEQVDEFMTVERYSHIMHLTSQVSGCLRPGKGPIDVLRATLPAGTVSGAPKVRAMEIIDELEPTKRGPYAGVIGYFDFSGNLDTAIAIRTMTITADGRASVQAGGGVVADSVPETEYIESCNKARALLAAVPAARRMRAAGTAARPAAPGAADVEVEVVGGG
ncbi:MAG: anthranilate synthase component I [Actinomycetota bacterium]